MDQGARSSTLYPSSPPTSLDASSSSPYSLSPNVEFSTASLPTNLPDHAYPLLVDELHDEQESHVRRYGTCTSSSPISCPESPHSIVTLDDDLVPQRPTSFHLQLSPIQLAAHTRLKRQLFGRTAADFKRERQRDWSFGPLTGHRLTVLTSVILFTAAIFVLQDLLWPPLRRNTGFRVVFADCSLIWLSIVIPSAIGFVGAMLYRHNDSLDDVAPIHHLVVWRVVSRGTNREALEQTVQRVRHEMAETPLFPYMIEVVTDIRSGLPEHEDLLELIVPSSYQPPHRAKFKARALHYALEVSRVPNDAWLVHLDEETRPTSSGIKGIAQLIAEEELSQRLRIGQGALLYHRLWDEHPFLTLADTMRTGDDLARFYLQHCFGVTFLGLHGSFIVCRNDVEKSVGFDFGPVGSITEDAFWALVCMQDGRRSRWVDGYMEEQSTHSTMDFLKQRRRWFHGLILVSLYAPVAFKYRVGLLCSTAIWALSPLATIYTISNLFIGCTVHWLVRLLANFAVSFYVMLYLVGAITNLDERAKDSRWRKLVWYVAQVLAVAALSLLEAASVFYAVLRPEKGFHVVTK